MKDINQQLAEMKKEEMCQTCEHPREKTLDNEYICRSCGSIEEIEEKEVPESLRSIVIQNIEMLTDAQEEDIKRMLKDANIRFKEVNG